MIHYEVKKREMKIGKHKGKTMFYAAPKEPVRLTTAMVEEQIVEKTSLARGDVRNAITSLAEVIRSALLLGGVVDLADLGTFKVEANGRMVATEAEVNASTIKTPRIRFYPKHEMRERAKNVGLSVDRPGKPSSVKSVEGREGDGSSPVGGEDGRPRTGI